ncbi:MAG: hypothetical protein IKH16_11595 [Selenomonadaceae bacterium]|nr:hypothetical protein [Selenomonadaceae bacterium]
MNKTVLILATHILNEGILSEYQKMKNTPGVDAVLMIDNNSKKFENKEKIESQTFFGVEAKCFFFDITVHEELGRPYFPADRDHFGDIMWYNGDYRFYYFRHYFPDYDYYWMMEYDVYLNSSTNSYAPFLDKYKKDTSDFLGPPLGMRKLGSDWFASQKADWIYKGQVYFTIFAVIRLSAKAIDFLQKRRMEHVDAYRAASGAKQWIFVEAFVLTELKNNGFSFGTTKEPHVLYDPPIDFNEQRIFEKRDDFLYHPVKPANPAPVQEVKDSGKSVPVAQCELASSFSMGRMKEFSMAIRGSEWFAKQAIALGTENNYEVSWTYLLILYRLLDEYHPRHILELNLGQATKMTAQYAASHPCSHTVIEHDRERVEHYLRCWKIPCSSNTSFRGSSLLKVKHGGHGELVGVVYQHFQTIAANRKYDLILLKSPAFEKGTYIHMELLLVLPDILSNDFAILMDHAEDPCGNAVLKDMASLLETHGVGFLRKDFVESGRKVCLLASKNWKYINEF